MTYQLTPKHAKLWLPVVRKLREYYEGKNDKFVRRCPFCDVAWTISPDLSRCPFCLWVLFEGEMCKKFVGYAGEKRRDRPSDWCKQSISRLKRWERRLEEIIRVGEK